VDAPEVGAELTGPDEHLMSPRDAVEYRSCAGCVRRVAPRLRRQVAADCCTLGRTLESRTGWEAAQAQGGSGRHTYTAMRHWFMREGWGPWAAAWNRACAWRRSGLASTRRGEAATAPCPVSEAASGRMLCIVVLMRG
jgi:hypothetical protein